MSQPWIQIEEQRLKRGHALHTFTGVNMWYAMHLGMQEPPGDRERLCREFDRLHRLGVSNLRIMASSEGPDDQPYRVTPSLRPAPDRWNEAVLDGLDFALSEIAQRGMYAVLVLNNFWEWSGGMGAYVAWDTRAAIPYPSDGKYRAFLDYAKRFYTSERCQQWYRETIERIVLRDNPYTQRSYRDEPAIFSWQLANEPRYYPQAWIRDTARLIKTLDERHLVSTGSEGSVGGDFVRTHKHDEIDYGTLHIWPQNWGWYDPDNPKTYKQAEREALQYLQQHIAWSEQLGKPLVLEEFGMPRDGKDPAQRLASTSPTTIRNRFFAKIYDKLQESHQRGGVLQGANLWTWTGSARPGHDLIGDPRHEPQGWYSVYEADAGTLELLSDQWYTQPPSYEE